MYVCVRAYVCVCVCVCVYVRVYVYVCMNVRLDNHGYVHTDQYCNIVYYHLNKMSQNED